MASKHLQIMIRANIIEGYFMNLTDEHKDVVRNNAIINISKLLEHPLYNSVSSDVKFSGIKLMTSIFGCSVYQWIGDGIMMSAGMMLYGDGWVTSGQYQKERDQEFIDEILNPLLTMTKAEIMIQCEDILEKYGAYNS